MYDLEQNSHRRKLAERIVFEIDRYAVDTYDNGNRSHLGASMIGKDCARELWYSFRWVGHKNTDPKGGRIQRLFQRGHLEEKRFIEYLRGIGFAVKDLTEDMKQIRVNAIEQHFGGSLDSILTFPESWEIKQSCAMLGEYKTKGTGSGFNKLKEDGIEITNKTHFVQMCVYGYLIGLNYAIYFAVNKNDDDLHVEVVKLKPEVAQDALRKAEHIIRSPVAPNRIAEQETFWQCKLCSYKAICWHGAKPAQNCRSCVYASAAPAGKWYCAGWKGIIPDEVMPKGCEQWVPL